MATLKSFARRNKENLFVKEVSSFDGMVDCVMPLNSGFKKTDIDTQKTGYFQTGIQGVYTVGSYRDYFTFYDVGNYIGIEVYNSCGCSILACKK